MASILPFQPRQSANRNPRSGQEPPAAIIIFPGVRYERRVDAIPPGTGEGGSRKRKRGAAK